MSTATDHLAVLRAPLERRFYARVTPSLPIFVAFGPGNLGALLNVSENGLLVSTPIGLDLNSVYRVYLCLDGVPNTIAVHVRTVWTAASQKHSGIQLLDLGENERQQLRTWGALQPSWNENLERCFAGENTEPTRKITEPPIPEESMQETMSLSSRASMAATERALSAERLQHEKVLVSRVALAPRTYSLSSKLVFLVWSACMAAICLAIGWSVRHGLLYKPVQRPSNFAKESAPPPSKQPAPFTPDASATLVPPEGHSQTGARPDSLAPPDAPKAFPSNIAPGRPARPKSPATKSPLIAASNHAHEIETPPASYSFLAESSPAPIPAKERVASSAPLDPAPLQSSSSAAATRYPVAKPSAENTLPRTSTITGPSDNSAPPRALAAARPSGSTAVPTRRTFSPTPPVSRPISATTYVARDSNPVVVQMDVPEDRVVELTPPSTASFVNLPGEQVVRSGSVTIHIQRSVWMHGDHWFWHSHKKVTLGRLASRVDPQIPRLPMTSGTITVQASVDKEGRISNLKPLYGSVALLPSVARALHEWRYEPTYLDRRAVETQAKIEVNFHSPTTRAPRP